MKVDINEVKSLELVPYISKADIHKMFGITVRTVCNQLNELEKFIAKGRYSEYSILRGCGYTFVNYLVLIDFFRYRYELLAGHRVPPFNPEEIAREIALGSEVNVDAI